MRNLFENRFQTLRPSVFKVMPLVEEMFYQWPSKQIEVLFVITSGAEITCCSFKINFNQVILYIAEVKQVRWVLFYFLCSIKAITFILIWRSNACVYHLCCQIPFMEYNFLVTKEHKITLSWCYLEHLSCGCQNCVRLLH